MSAQLPARYWPADRVRAHMDATIVADMEPLPPDLTAAEQAAVRELVAAGWILDDIFQDQMHPQGLRARAALRALHAATGRRPETAALVELQDLWQGPIVTTPDNARKAFLPVGPEVPGKHLYPQGATRATIEAFLADHPEERAAILHSYTVVRATTRAALRRDLATLRRHPALGQLHPTLGPRWRAMIADQTPPTFYAVPYAIAWADQLIAAAAHLDAAAAAIAPEDADFAAFLRLRARDFLANDYEGGDAAWTRGRFRRLDVVAGPYETYDDDLFGVKCMFGLRVLVRDLSRSASLEAAVVHLQSIENDMPTDRHRVIQTDIPVGIYDAVADFGNQRFGTVIAEILPNDPDLLRKYGRKIVLAHNLIVAPGLTARLKRTWRAVFAPAHDDDLTENGLFEGSVWHEVGHYLGPTHQVAGGSVSDALEDASDPLEELKADLVSSFAAARLVRVGHFEPAVEREIQACLVSSGLFSAKPLPTEAHLAGRLVMTNGFFEHGAIVPGAGAFEIRYEAMDAAIESMLRDVLEIQSRGTRADAWAWINARLTWDHRHEAIAAAVKAAEPTSLIRFRNPPGLRDLAGFERAPRP